MSESDSPAKRSWKKVEERSSAGAKKKESGKSSAGARKVVSGTQKSSSTRGKPRKPNRHGFQYMAEGGVQNIKDLRSPEESLVDCVRRVSSQGILMESRDFYDTTNLLPTDLQQEVLILQYEVAKKRRAANWIHNLRYSCQFSQSNAWIDRFLPSLDGKTISVPAKKRTAVSASAGRSDPTRDARLLDNPELPVFRDNAGEDASSDLVAVMKTEAESPTTEPGNQPVLQVIPERPIPVEPAIQERSAMEPVASDLGAESTVGLSLPELPIVAQKRGSEGPRRKKSRMVDSSQEVLSVTVMNRPDRPTSHQQPIRQEQELIYCPFQFCGSMDKNIKRHVSSRHFAPALKLIATCAADVELQLRSLSWLIQTVLGPNSTFSDAIKWVNDQGSIPQDVTLHVAAHEEVYEMACRNLGDQPPTRFSLHPVNSPAVLLFWRCVLALLVQCNQRQCEDFHRLDATRCNIIPLCQERMQAEPVLPNVSVTVSTPSPPPHSVPLPDPSDSKIEGEFIVVDEVMSDESDVSFLEPGIQIPQVFDSHFHLDRTSRKIWSSDRGHTVKELIEYSYSPQVAYHPATRVEVVGGIVNCSEPKTYPDVNFVMEGPWRVAVGLHLKHYDTSTVDRQLILQQLLNHPKVVELGECGLDRTVPASKWVKQEDAFRRMLRLGRVHQPLILHLRGPPEDAYGSDVNALCIMLMEEHCKRFTPTVSRVGNLSSKLGLRNSLTPTLE